LRNDGVPEPIVETLHPLVNHTIRGEARFWTAVTERLDAKHAARYHDLILKHVQGPPLMPLIKWLAVGVALGGFCQLLFQLPALFRRGFRFRPNCDYRLPALRKIGRLWLPSLVGVAVHEIIVFVSTILASVLPEGSVSYLYYANRLIEFPQGIFGVAIATAVLPTMSAQAARQEYDQLAETLSFALRLMGFLTIPATVGLIVLRVPIVTTLFERGAFTSDATQATAQALLFYAFGLFAIAGVRIMAPVFYAMKDTTTPVQCAVITFSIDIACSLHLMGRLQHNGLALATAIAAWVNLALLIGLLRKRLGHIDWRGIVRSESKILAAALIMGSCCAPFAAQATQHPGVFVAVTLGGVLVYILCAALLQCEELQVLSQLLLKKLRIS
jgi:putative peptidoglycan lipid II flippase